MMESRTWLGVFVSAQGKASWIVGVVLLAALPARGAEFVVDAGPLRAIVATDPWRVTFTESGRPVLVEAADPGLGPSGPLGFRTAAGWVHATRAQSVESDGRVLTAAVETNDALGRRLAVRLARDALGVIEIEARIEGEAGADVEALGIGFDAAEDERFFGFGERADVLDHRGQVVESYVSDGPYDPSDRAFIAAVLAFGSVSLGGK